MRATLTQISPSELDYVTKSIQVGIRADGRKNIDYRQILISTNLVSQASGSCRAKIHETEVIVTIKLQIASIDEPKIKCSLDCSPNISRYFSRKHIADLTVQYSEYLNKTLNASHGGIDLDSLVIIPGVTCWNLQVDALILNYSGNLFDTVMLAVRGALDSTRMAATTIEELSGRFEFDVADYESLPLVGSRDVPICVTVTKIGSRFIFDASLLEDSCADARLMVSVNRRGVVCAVNKDGSGGIEPAVLNEMIQNAREIGLQMIKEMDIVLDKEMDRFESGQDVEMF